MRKVDSEICRVFVYMLNSKSKSNSNVVQAPS